MEQLHDSEMLGILLRTGALAGIHLASLSTCSVLPSLTASSYTPLAHQLSLPHLLLMEALSILCDGEVRA